MNGPTNMARAAAHASAACLGVFGALAASLAACGTEPAAAPPSDRVTTAVENAPEAEHEEPASGVSTDERGPPFARAVLWKPAAEPAPDGLDPYLAPLIYAEATDGPAARLGPDAAPRVSYSRSSWTRPGGDLTQWTFAWETLRPGHGEGSAGGDPQAVRITFGSDGYPALIEVLVGPEGRAEIYVTEDLEGLAVEEHGPALAGKQHSIEGAASRVAAVVGTGAMPMGPFVYEPAGTPGVPLVHCRCSPSRVEEVLETREYALESATAGPFAPPEEALAGLRLPARF